MFFRLDNLLYFFRRNTLYGISAFMYYRVIINEGGNINMKMKKVLAIGLSAAMIMSVTPGTVTAADLDADVAVEEFSDDADDTVALESEEPEVEENDSDQAAEIEFQDEDTDVQQNVDQEASSDDVALFSDGEENAPAVGDGSDDLQWHLEDSDEDGFDDTLVVDGYGDMSEYNSHTDYPWYPYANSVKYLVIGDNITAIGRNAFYEFENLENVTLGKNVIQIKSSAFEKCAKLVSIIISENVKEIGWYAFKDCSTLNNVILSDSVTIIGNSAFENCKALEKIKMSMNIESIGDYAFFECKRVGRLFLPKTLKKIGDSAFFYYTGRDKHFIVSKIHYSGTKSDWEKIEGVNVRIYSGSLTDLVHYAAYHAKKSATCITSGFEEYWTCNRCGQYAFADIECTQKLDAVPKIPALGHDLDQGNISKEANCTEEGVVTYSCQREGCDYTETKSIPTNGKHIYGEPSYTWNEDNTECTATEICSLCKYEDIESVKTQETTLIPATCSQEGKVHYTAVFTNNNFTTQDKEVIVPQLSHKNTEIRNARNATCESSGYSGDIYCKDCGKFLSEGSIIKAKGHLWDDGTVKKEPTCVEKGVKTYTCANCKATKTEDIKALGHKEVKDAAVTATCEKDGLTEGSHCSVCNKVLAEQQKVPATGHKFSSWKTTSQATVFSPEQQSRSCSVCGKSENREIGSKLQKTMTVTATSLPLKTKQKTTVLRVSGLAVGDSIISWKSSNTKVAKVSGRANGTSTITAGNKKGTAKITITLKSGLQKVVKVTVQKSTVKTKKITGVSKSLKLNKKQRAVLRPVIAPLTSKQKITYKSSNSKVASVNSKGQITAKKKGTAVITVKSGSKTVKCKVTVK